MSRSDAASATPLLAVLLALAVVAGGTLSAGLRGVIESERAAVAADAVAIAGVLGGEALARRVAHANGVVILETNDTSALDGRFEVRVRLGARAARATAADTWFPTAPTLPE